MSELIARRNVVVMNPQGLHLRPADLFVKLARRFAANVEVIKDSERVDGKSVLAMLALAAVENTELVIEAQGADAEEAVAALAELFVRGFAEGDPAEGGGATS